MRLRFTPSARREFLDVIDYIRRDRPMAAERFRQKVERILRRLETFPESGPRIPEFRDLPYREIIVRPYRFFYKIAKADDTVWIVAVWHGAQLPDKPE